MYFNRRYRAESDYAKPTATTTVRDTKTGAILFTAGQCADGDYKARQALDELAGKWLDEHFPDNADPLAYWTP